MLIDKILTTVVTTCGRPKFLREALASVAAHRVRNVVVVAARADDELTRILESFRSEFDSFTTLQDPGDPGVNELWIRGIYAAQTDWVNILHDDDLLDEGWGWLARGAVLQLQHGNAGFAVGGITVFDEQRVDDPIIWLKKSTGVHSSFDLSELLMRKGALTVTPGCAILNRELSIRTLKDWENRYESYYKSCSATMVGGNDLLLMQRHCEVFPSMYWHEGPVLRCRRHAGSATITYDNKSGRHVLDRMYGGTRKSVRQAPGLSDSTAAGARRFVVWNPPKKGSDRSSKAHASWGPSIAAGMLYPLYFTPESAPLAQFSGQRFNDGTDFPIVHDMLDYAATFALPEDFIGVCNSDIGVYHGADIKIKELTLDPEREVALFWRESYRKAPPLPMPRLKTGLQDGGVDLILFRRRWWDQWKKFIPRMYLGCVAWDFVFRTFVTEWAHANQKPSALVPGMIWHEIHRPGWAKSKGKEISKPNAYNKSISLNFFHCRGSTEAIHLATHAETLGMASPIIQQLEADEAAGR